MNIFGMNIFVDTFGRTIFVILKATVSMALLITAKDLKTTELSTYIMSLRHSISYCILFIPYLLESTGIYLIMNSIFGRFMES